MPSGNFGPLIAEFKILRVVFDICLSLIFVFGCFAVSRSKIIPWIALVLSIPMLLSVWVGYVGVEMPQLTLVGNISGIAYFALISGAILAFVFAESVEGNGFIAAFVAGLGLTMGTTSEIVRHRIQEFGETEGTQLILIVFLIFGLAMVPLAVPYWGAPEWIYALASLTILRMLPVAISLIGAKLDWRTIAFIGWFGPRGIASVLYLLMAVAATGVAGHERVMSIIVLTIAISVYAHGISAVPLSRRYGQSTSVDLD